MNDFSRWSIAEKQRRNEDMAYVRSHKPSAIDLDNRKRFYSQNYTLVQNSRKEIEQINTKIYELLTLIDNLNSNEKAWSLMFNSPAEMMKQELNLPANVVNLILSLQKTDKTLFPTNETRDLKLLDFFRKLKDNAFSKRLIKLIQDKEKKVTLDRAVQTLKSIKAGKVKYQTISHATFTRFLSNTNIKKFTRDQLELENDIDKNKGLESKNRKKRKSTTRGFDDINPTKDDWDIYDET